MATITDKLNQLEQDREDLVDNLETKGITGLTGDETFTELVPEVLNIPSGGGGIEPAEKDVNFYDYDGTRVYSYTRTEFLELNEMPANPTHDGLTAQGWNWTLADAKSFVTSYDILDIGQTYLTSDNSTKIYVSLDEYTLKPYLGFGLNGTATIYWGDNTSETVTGTNANTLMYTPHTYNNAGDYVIKIVSESNINLIGSGYAGILNKTNSNVTENSIYASKIIKLELGNTSLGNYVLNYCINLKSIAGNFAGLGTTGNGLKYCYNLKCLVFKNQSFGFEDTMINQYSTIEKLILPKQLLKFGNTNYSSFMYDHIKRIMIDIKNANAFSFTNGGFAIEKMVVICPSTIKISGLANLVFLKFNPTASNFTGSGYFIKNCPCLRNLKIPKKWTTIDANTFTGNRSMEYYDFSEHEAIPTLANINAFANMPSDCKIIVPDSLYSTWIATSPWNDSSIVDHIISKTNWDNL